MEWQVNGEKFWGLIKSRHGARENQEAQKIASVTRLLFLRNPDICPIKWLQVCKLVCTTLHPFSSVQSSSVAQSWKYIPN